MANDFEGSLEWRDTLHMVSSEQLWTRVKMERYQAIKSTVYISIILKKRPPRVIAYEYLTCGPSRFEERESYFHYTEVCSPRVHGIPYNRRIYFSYTNQNVNYEEMFETFLTDLTPLLYFYVNHRLDTISVIVLKLLETCWKGCHAGEVCVNNLKQTLIEIFCCKKTCFFFFSVQHKALDMSRYSDFKSTRTQ